MKKNIYLVTGYIPSDEKNIYMSIWCLVPTKTVFIGLMH